VERNGRVEEARGIHFYEELLDEVILSFLRDNKMTKNEMDWLKSHGELNEFEVLRLIGKIIKNRASS
jgi:hypothetical protein